MTTESSTDGSTQIETQCKSIFHYIKLSVWTFQKTTGAIKSFQRSQFGLKFHRLELHWVTSPKHHAMLPKAETPPTSVFATNSAVAYHDSRCGVTSWEKPRANLRHGSSNLFSTLEYCWRLFCRFLHWSEHRLSTAPRISLRYHSHSSHLHSSRWVTHRHRQQRSKQAANVALFLRIPSQLQAGKARKQRAAEKHFSRSVSRATSQLRGSPCSSAAAIYIYWVFNRSSDHRRFHRRLGRECIVSPCFVLQRVAIPPRSGAGISGWGG